MIKSLFYKFWPAIVITAVIFAFHIRLFLPEPSIYITPDYGRSDAWHFSIANKFYYAQELKKNRIPIWNPHIGMGFPTLAEGQTAIFFLPNLIFFRLLPFVWAYNLTLVMSFLTAGWGIYMFCRSLGLSKLASTYAGIIFPLGGFFVFHVQHHHLLQTASITPWLFWAVSEFLRNKKISFLLALSILLSQQLFAGFHQITFYSLVMLSVFLGLNLYKAKFKFKLVSVFVISMVLGFAIAAVQVLPTYELLRVSVRDTDPQRILTEFPYKLKNLLQFIDPFILGSPRDGTYPRWIPKQWGIYWESVAYIGIIPILLVLSHFIPFKKNPGYKTYTRSMLLILGISLLLSLGLASPLHPIFSIPPFSLFRVPSRFLFTAQLSLVILAALSINMVKSKKFIIAVTIISIFNLFNKFFYYNPVTNASKWFTPPDTAGIIKSDSTSRIITLGQFSQWSDIFPSKGWQETNYYYFAREALDQNSNLIFGVDQFSAYESIPPKRHNLLNSLIFRGVTTSSDNVKISSSSAKLLAADNVSYLISTKDYDGQDFEKVYETPKYQNYSFKILKNKLNPQRLFMTSSYAAAKSVDDITEKITSPNFDPTKQIVLEKEPDKSNLNLNNWTAQVLSGKDSSIQIKTDSIGNGFLVLSDSYYPSWNAYIDGKPTEIYAANINSRAVLVPEGKHNITFTFKPKTFIWGGIISTFAIINWLFLISRFRRKVRFLKK